MALPTTSTFGIGIRFNLIYETTAGYPVNYLRVKIQRAPDSGGSPTTSSITTVASILVSKPSTYLDWMDALPLDGNRRHYRFIQTKTPYRDSDPTGWVSAKPTEVLPT